MSEATGSRSLSGKVALVAGATRGAGRAIAVELGRAGAFVYATGRSGRVAGRSEVDRPETIEETGELIAAAGGEGAALRVYYDLVKAVERIVIGLTAELAGRPCTALAVTSGWLRSERMLENFGVTAATWREALLDRPHFCSSDSPTYVGRGIAALAADPDAGRYAGRVVSSAELARTYGVTDIDGTQPDCWRYLVEIQLPGRPATELGYR
jgi:hypothetical protein